MQSHTQETHPLQLCCPHPAPRIWLSVRWGTPRCSHSQGHPLTPSGITDQVHTQTLHCWQCQSSPAHVRPATVLPAPTTSLHTPGSKLCAWLPLSKRRLSPTHSLAGGRGEATEEDSERLSCLGCKKGHRTVRGGKGANLVAKAPERAQGRPRGSPSTLPSYASSRACAI